MAEKWMSAEIFSGPPPPRAFSSAPCEPSTASTAAPYGSDTDRMPVSAIPASESSSNRSTGPASRFATSDPPRNSVPKPGVVVAVAARVLLTGCASARDPRCHDPDWPAPAPSGPLARLRRAGYSPSCAAARSAFRAYRCQSGLDDAERHKANRGTKPNPVDDESGNQYPQVDTPAKRGFHALYSALHLTYGTTYLFQVPIQRLKCDGVRARQVGFPGGGTGRRR